MVGDEELWVWFKELGTDEARLQEARVLLEYSRRYGEPPPLNLNVGRQLSMVLGLRRLSKSLLAVELDPDIRDALGL